MIPALISAIPSIISLFNKDERSGAVKTLTKKVVGEISGKLNVDFKNKKEVIDHLENNPEQAARLKEIDNKYKIDIANILAKDKSDARNFSVNIQSSKDWLVRNTGSLIGLLTVLSAFCLDAYILYKGFIVGMESLNPVVTLIAGHVSARAGQVLSFYFGMSKTEADNQRKN